MGSRPEHEHSGESDAQKGISAGGQGDAPGTRSQQVTELTRRSSHAHYRESALGGSPLPDVALCLALGAVYLVIGVLVTERVLRAARMKAALALS